MADARGTSDGDGHGDPFVGLRQEMVRTQIEGRGVTDERVLSAMATVARHRFVDGAVADHAYEDRPLSIGGGQTISQPFMVAFMAQAAEIDAGDRVLEIGTGSGYGAAVLARLAAEVYSIERRLPLAEAARRRLRGEGLTNVTVVVGDGSTGLVDKAPFDAIVVTAAGDEIPEALCRQLADGGRLIAPVGPQSGEQQLIRVRRRGDSYANEELGAVRFVPLIVDD